MDIFDILLDILLKPPQPFIGLFLTIPGPFEYFSENRWSQKISFLNEGAIVTHSFDILTSYLNHLSTL